MATENVKLKVDVETGQAAKSLGTLKKEFKELQLSLDGVKQGSKEYVQILKDLADRKDAIEDIRQEIEGLGGTDKKFAALSKTVSGVAGGFTAVQGAMALLGSESQETQEALLKVQSALALSQGISQVTDLGQSFKVLGNIIKANPLILLVSVVASLIGYFVGLENIIGGVKAGFQALGEIVSQAFDAIVDGILYAIDLYTQYLDILTFGLFDINGAYTDYIENIEEANRKERERIEALTLQIEKSKEIIAALKEQLEANERALKAVEEREQAVVKAYDKEIELAKASGENTEQLEKDKLEFVRESLQEKLKLQLKSFEDTKALAAEELKLSQTLFERNQGYDKLFATALKETNSKKVSESKATLDKLKQQIDDNAQAILVKDAETERERREQSQAAYEERLKAEEEYLKRKKALEDLYAEQDRKFREDAAKEYLEYLKGLKEEEISINFDALEENVKINEQESLDDINKTSEEFKRFKLVQDAKVSMLSSTLNTLASLTDLFGKKNEANAKKAFEVNKALSIGEALIKTYQGANAIFAAAAANPASVLFPAQPFISAGLAIVAGLGNVAKIASTKYGGGAASGGGGGTSAPSAPSVNAPSSTGSNSIGTTLLNRQAIEQGQQPTENRVFVVESDMTSTQRRVSGIRNRATIVE